jgi:hypothetical protein
MMSQIIRMMITKFLEIIHGVNYCNKTFFRIGQFNFPVQILKF